MGFEKPEIKAFLNSNPVLEGEVLVDPHGRDIKFSNTPFIEVLVEGLKGREFEVLLRAGRIEERQKVLMEEGLVRCFFPNTRFSSEIPREAEVTIKGEGVELNRRVQLITHSVSGRALDFSGNPIQAFAWATQGDFMPHEIIAQSDEKGYFHINCPQGRRLWLFVGDRNYGKSTLEGWITCPNLQTDLEIPEIRVGDFEIYDLKAWFSAGVWHVFFVPARVNTDFPPELTVKDIKVWIEEEPGEILEMTKHLVAGDYPSYMLSVVSPVSWKPGKTQKIRVRVDGEEKGKGEAWCINY